MIIGTAPLAVLDTNVLVAGLCRRKGSPSFRVLQDIWSGKIPLVLTQKLYLEYESVLSRKKIMKLIDADIKEVRIILDALLFLALKSEVFYMWRPNLPDEKDNFVLEAAVATGGVIITKNVADFQRSELKFPDLIIMTPQQYCNLYL